MATMRMLTALLRRLDSALPEGDRSLVSQDDRSLQDNIPLVAETIDTWAHRNGVYGFGAERAAKTLVENRASWGTMCDIFTGLCSIDSQALREFADIVAGGSGTGVRTVRKAFGTRSSSHKGKIVIQPHFCVAYCVEDGRVTSVVFSRPLDNFALCAVRVTLPADSGFFVWCFANLFQAHPRHADDRTILSVMVQIRELFSFLQGTDRSEALWGGVDPICREFSRGFVPLSLAQWQQLLAIFAKDRGYRVRPVGNSYEVRSAIWADSHLLTRMHLGPDAPEMLLEIDRIEAERVCSFYFFILRTFPRHVSCRCGKRYTRRGV